VPWQFVAIPQRSQLVKTGKPIMKKFILAAAMTMALSGAAFASQCPALMQKIDAAMAKAAELAARGKAEHEAGDHAASEATLGEAMKLLGI
jgi:uncharacterized membrane protein